MTNFSITCSIVNWSISFNHAAQRVLAGENKGIMDSLIRLEVEAEGIPDLTLIDLPGITGVAAEGQSKSIPEQVCGPSYSKSERKHSSQLKRYALPCVGLLAV